MVVSFDLSCLRGRRTDKSARIGQQLTFWCILAIPLRKKSIAPARRVAGMVEDIVGCKWSLTVLDLVSRGVCRPGAMQRSVSGLTPKVLNERLRKLTRFGILDRQVFAEVPPRVEYRLTPFGQRFGRVLEQIAALERELA
jgi:DNA-binding HxlR family transcriptional regulator